MKEKQLSDIVIRPYRVFFRSTALRHMYASGMSEGDIQVVVRSGKIIDEHPDGTPCPSYLLRGKIRGRPIHAVVPYDKNGDVVYVTAAYEPDANRWDATFSRRER